MDVPRGCADQRKETQDYRQMIDPIQIIRDIQTEKESAKVDPAYALFNEIMTKISEQVKKELNEAVAAGKLEFHKTLNNIAFNLKK